MRGTCINPLAVWVNSKLEECQGIAGLAVGMNLGEYAVLVSLDT